MIPHEITTCKNPVKGQSSIQEKTKNPKIIMNKLNIGRYLNFRTVFVQNPKINIPIPPSLSNLSSIPDILLSPCSQTKHTCFRLKKGQISICFDWNLYILRML